VPVREINWFAFAALSEIVTVSTVGPGEAGMNCTVSVHFFCGNSCKGQFVAPVLGNPNTCGLVAGTDANGLPNVIGAPDLAELVSVNVSCLAVPRFTLPKIPASGLTVRNEGTSVAVAVGVAVLVAVAVAVAVAPAVAVAVGVPPAVAVGVAVGVGVDVPPSWITYKTELELLLFAST